MQISTPRARVAAVLGPTNTGKTHLAMERMLAHPTGMIGFPLRLLARENYRRAVRLKGRNAVALITGEEKILPLGARYFVCTAESMPVDRSVEFLAVDEIQMCGDSDRGHVFTDRLLHARGTGETMFLGAATIRPLIRQLVPEAEFLSRPRFSSLTFTGVKKTSRLPKRSAIVAFSAADVYAIAELVRRQRGGAAIVMGALSPRTRNAQVEMYQSGEVDYLVATDAIGMGLNMDVDHVAFAATRKFDGRFRRALSAAELAQITGRAGRHMNDGTFGTTGDTAPLEAEVVSRIENHEFEPLTRIQWRNPRPSFASLDRLVASLSVPPELAGLTKARRADDETVLRQLAEDPEIAARVRALEGEPDDAFHQDVDAAGRLTGRLSRRGDAVARLSKSPTPLKPTVEPLASDLLDPPARARIGARLQTWIDGRIRDVLSPLLRLQAATLGGPARGPAFQMAENLGSLARRQAQREIDALSRADRKALKDAGVRIGRESLYLAELLKPEAVAWRGLLFALHHGLALPAPVPAPGRVSAAPHPGASEAFYESIGYRRLGSVVLRLDMVERVAGKAWALNRQGAFVITPELMSLAGCGADDTAALLRKIDYRRVKVDGEDRYRFRSPAKRSAKGRHTGNKPGEEKTRTAKRRDKAVSQSPFDVLKGLEVGQ